MHLGHAQRWLPQPVRHLHDAEQGVGLPGRAQVLGEVQVHPVLDPFPGVSDLGVGVRASQQTGQQRTQFGDCWAVFGDHGSHVQGPPLVVQQPPGASFDHA